MAGASYKTSSTSAQKVGAATFGSSGVNVGGLNVPARGLSTPQLIIAGVALVAGVFFYSNKRRSKK